MFHTIADSRTVISEEPLVTFRETPAGVPPAVKSLFYGGEYRGYQFVYPRGGPNMIPEIVPQPEITYLPAPAAAPEPTGEVVLEPMVEGAPEPVVEQAAEPVPAPEPVELPKTASALPMLAVGGLTSLLAGFGLALIRRRAR
jgi:LPXTG-motif cell wall-anchored protein